MRRLITLTTDFGLDDGYAGTVKGVILGINPEANVVDISHGIAPQDTAQAAFIIGTAYRFFPADTVHVVVVDPEVGSERRAIAIATPDGIFVAPDNGVLSWVIRDQVARSERFPREGRIRLRGTGLKGVSLANPRYWLPKTSKTFHARDIFGTVAAHLTLGVPLAEVGEPLADVLFAAPPQPQKRADGSIVGHIVYVDHFGNLITDLTATDIEQMPGEPIFEIVGRTVAGLSSYYAERSGLLALVGSSGHIEIAVSGASAAKELRARPDDVVVVRGTV